jgi:hypothetical protein
MEGNNWELLFLPFADDNYFEYLSSDYFDFEAELPTETGHSFIVNVGCAPCPSVKSIFASCAISENVTHGQLTSLLRGLLTCFNK